jgi:pimeloyl-ACP methyl ester carboxylesterase
MKHRFWGLFAVLILVATLLPACAPSAVEMPVNIRPIVFVHGFAGSAAQFESQAMRFESNGYPATHISAYEYDSAAGLSPQFPPASVLDGVDQAVDAALKNTGADKVDLIGHSLGTKVSQLYLKSSPERAGKVAHYVNIDGQASTELPGGVPTLALWAGRRPPAFMAAGEVVGATNITLPNVTHVECATSPEAFVEMYRFLTGKEPATDKILAEPSGNIELAGRTVIFPQNKGVQEPGAALQIWEVDGKTGARVSDQPLATYPMDNATGDWGPFSGKSGLAYEFCLIQEPFSTHYYFQPFIRSDYLIRMNTEIPGKGLTSHADTGDRQSNLLITRNKEFWGDQGANSDVLTVDGSNVVTPAICPLDHLVIAIFVYDNGADEKSDLTKPIPFFFTVIPFFLTGADLYIPAANPPNRAVPLVLTSRGGGGETQVINVPNWVSTKDRISVQFNDFVQ